MNRGLWFVAGAGVGIYAVAKARRVAEGVSPDGLRDRLAGLSLGAHLFIDELKTEMVAQENELRRKRPLETARPLELTRKGND